MQAFQWTAERTPEEAMQYREDVTRAVEAGAKELLENGQAAAWLGEADVEIAAVIASVHGPLAEQLARETCFPDAEAVQSLRKGGPLVGSIPASADSKEHAYPPGKHESTLTSACRQRTRS